MDPEDPFFAFICMCSGGTGVPAVDTSVPRPAAKEGMYQPWIEEPRPVIGSSCRGADAEAESVVHEFGG